MKFELTAIFNFYFAILNLAKVSKFPHRNFKSQKLIANYPKFERLHIHSCHFDWWPHLYFVEIFLFLSLNRVKHERIIRKLSLIGWKSNVIDLNVVSEIRSQFWMLPKSQSCHMRRAILLTFEFRKLVVYSSYERLHISSRHFE